MIKPKDEIINITPYETDRYLPDWEYKLDSNENFYGANDTVINAIRNFDPKKISLYPAYGELIDKLSDRYSVLRDEILLTNGCDEALNLLISTYLNKGDEFLSYNPSFSMPQLYAQAAGGKIKLINYLKKYEFNEADFSANLKGVKIAYIGTPNNPTGEIVQAQTIEKLAKEFQNTLFIIDCTYINFSYEAEFKDYISLLKYENIAIVKSFSKDFALAGLRLGFILADKNIILNLKKVSSPYNVNAVVIECALKVLDDFQQFEKVKKDNRASYEILYEGLKALGYKPNKSEGNFILCDFLEHTDFVYQKLCSNNIIVRKYGSNSELKTSLRITLPNLNGVKKILELIAPRPLYVFDLDGVVFDVSQSYRQAIIETCKKFTGKTVTASEIQEVKNQGGMSNDWKVTKYLIEKEGVEISYEKTVEAFQELFFDETKPVFERGLIDKEKLVFKPEFFAELSKFANCAVFTSRDAKEAFYSLEKFDVKKYFSYFITSESVGQNPKPSPCGLNIIKKHCPYNKIYYFGDTIDDIKAGIGANVSPFGIIPPNASMIDETIQRLKEAGAKMVFKNPDEILEADLINKKEMTCV